MEALQKLQTAAIVKQNGIENSQELGNKKITLRNHILNLDFICALWKEFMISSTYFLKSWGRSLAF